MSIDASEVLSGTMPTKYHKIQSKYSHCANSLMSQTRRCHFSKPKTATNVEVSTINLWWTRLRFYCCKLFNLLVKHPWEDATALLNTATNLTRPTSRKYLQLTHKLRLKLCHVYFNSKPVAFTCFSALVTVLFFFFFFGGMAVSWTVTGRDVKLRLGLSARCSVTC
jgi:hypothetical protein